MGIDLDKMRNKYAKLNNKGGSTDDRFWKPQEGTQTIRIVCPLDGDPFRDYLYHYRLGADNNVTFISPRTFGKTDPIAEFGNQLWNEGTDESKEMARKFFPKMRVFAPVVVRGEEEKGVRIWGFSKTTYERLLNIVLDPEYGDVTDIHSGTDIRLDYGKKSGQMYASTELRPNRRTSALAKTEAEIDNIMSTMPDFSEIFKETTTDEASELLGQTLSGATDDTSQGKVQYSPTKSNDSSTSVTDIEHAFDELLS